MPSIRNVVLRLFPLMMPAVLVAGCGDSGSPTESAEERVAPPLVTSADPLASLRGQRLSVRIRGSGFDSTAVASWEQNGAVDPNLVVLSTRYVNPTELLVDLNVAPDAPRVQYDIGVTIRSGAGRKKGSGVEKGTGRELFWVGNGATLAGVLRTEGDWPQLVEYDVVGPSNAKGDSMLSLWRWGHGDALPNGGMHISHDLAATIAAGTGPCKSTPAGATEETKAALLLKFRHNPVGYPRGFRTRVDLLSLGLGPSPINEISSNWVEPDGLFFNVTIIGPTVTKLSSREYQYTGGEAWIRDGGRSGFPGVPILSCPNLDTVVVTYPW